MAEVPSHKFFQLNKIAIALGIKKDKVYNNFNDKYDSLDGNGDKQKIAKFMIPHVQKFFQKLGMDVTFRKQA